MARTTQGTKAAATIQRAIAQLQALQREHGPSGYLIASDDTAPVGDLEYPVRVSRDFITSAEEARLQLVVDIGITPVDARKAGMWPEFENAPIVDALGLSSRLLERWQQTPEAVAEGGKLSGKKALMYGALGVGALYLLRKKAGPQEADDYATMQGYKKADEIPFGALGSKSRSLRVALMGGAAGIGALGAQFLLKDVVFGPIVGGVFGATAFAALAEQRFILELPKIAVYGGASGLAGAVLADQFTADADPGKIGSFFGRAGLGAFFGGATSSLTLDTVAPPELKVVDDLDDAKPSDVSISGDLPELGDVDLVPGVPPGARDVSGFEIL